MEEFAYVMCVKDGTFVCSCEAVVDVCFALLYPLVELSYGALDNGFGWLCGNKVC